MALINQHTYLEFGDVGDWSYNDYAADVLSNEIFAAEALLSLANNDCRVCLAMGQIKQTSNYVEPFINGSPHIIEVNSADELMENYPYQPDHDCDISLFYAALRNLAIITQSDYLNRYIIIVLHSGQNITMYLYDANIKNQHRLLYRLQITSMTISNKWLTNYKIHFAELRYLNHDPEFCKLVAKMANWLEGQEELNEHDKWLVNNRPLTRESVAGRLYNKWVTEIKPSTPALYKLGLKAMDLAMQIRYKSHV